MMGYNKNAAISDVSLCVFADTGPEWITGEGIPEGARSRNTQPDVRYWQCSGHGSCKHYCGGQGECS
jgi:hypothetical protein